MSRFLVVNKQHQDPTEADPIPHQFSECKAIGKKLDSQRFQSNKGTTVVVDIVEQDNTAPDNSSEEGGYYEEAAVPLTIKTTTGPGSRTDDSFEGTEITMAPPRKLDKYGFIMNIDDRGKVYDSTSPPNGSSSGALAFAEDTKTTRRERKWGTTLDAWDRRRPKKIKERLRKGIPDSMRGRVWLALGGGIGEPGLYQKIVQVTSNAMLESCKAAASQIVSAEKEGSSPATAKNGREESTGTMTSLTTLSTECSSPSSGLDDSRDTQQDSGSAQQKNHATSVTEEKSSSLDQDDYPHSKAFRMVQETIERDLHRTYPRHNLFFEDETARDDEAIASAASSVLGLSGACDPDLASLVLNLERDIKTVTTKGATSKPLITSPSSSKPSDKLTSPNGQAALRRVLRAYSYYDREISYCQGMNFIAGMFLTVMSEEEAFWLLVDVMHNKPCEMRGMFGEGMRETHKVLYVAERLTHMHLPKLARHFDRENIHVTMYATQWLLTQYTSSFRFDLVTRVWDAFLGEGWKIIYRVMLALLQQWQSQLLKMSFEEILAFFRELPDRVNGNSVMETAMRINLKTRQIVRLEKEWRDKHQ